MDLQPFEGEKVPLPLMLLINFDEKHYDSAGKLKELFKKFAPDSCIPAYNQRGCTGQAVLVWFELLKLHDAQLLQVQLDKHKHENHVRSTRWVSREDWAVWEQHRPKWISKLLDRQQGRGVEWQPVSHWLAQARQARQDTQQLAGQQEQVIGQLQSQLKEQEEKVEEGRLQLQAMRAELEQARSNAGQAGVEEMEMLFQKLEVQRAVNMGEKVLKQHSESYLKKIELERDIKSRQMELRVHQMMLADKKQQQVEQFGQQQKEIEQRVQERVQQHVQQQEEAMKQRLETILRQLTDDHEEQMALKQAELAEAQKERDRLESEAGDVDLQLFYQFMQRDSAFRDFESKLQDKIVAKIAVDAPDMAGCVRTFAEITHSDLQELGILPNNDGDRISLTSIWSERLKASVPPERNIKCATGAEREELNELKRLGFPEPFHPPWIFKSVATAEGPHYVIREEDEVLPLKPPKEYEEGSEAYKLYCSKFCEANTMHTGFVKMIRSKYGRRAQDILDYLKKKYAEFLKHQLKANAHAKTLWNTDEDREMTIAEKLDTLLAVHRAEVGQLHEALRLKENELRACREQLKVDQRRGRPRRP